MSGLAPLGIVLRDHCHPGEHRAGCPHCAMLKPRPGDDALAVRVESDGSATALPRCAPRWRCGTPRSLSPRTRSPVAISRTVAAPCRILTPTSASSSGTGTRAAMSGPPWSRS